LEKSEIVLGAYAKTKLLKAGESQLLSLSFTKRDMASYDYKNEEAYVVDAGKYKISLRRDVRSEVYYFDYNIIEKTVYKTDEVTGKKIKNLFSSAYDGFKILSRQDPVATAPTLEAREVSEAVLKADSLPKPKLGLPPRMGVSLPEGTISLQDVYKDPSKWEAFLDQMTLDELTLLVTVGGYKTAGIERLGIPETADNDGPASVKGRHGIFFKDSGAAYPCATALACSFNGELAYEMGESVAREAAYMGTDIWYAPGANIHRNPCGGRNFEYYSEDPLLSGKMAARVMAGAASGGLVSTLKHYALNDQEQNRMGVFTWADEQTLREIYLKAFEIAVKESGCKGMMTGLNRIGPDWCGASGALNKELLRGEWGFEGFVVSDFAVNYTGFGYMNPALCVYNGNDTMLTGLYPLQKVQYTASVKFAYYRDPVGFGRALREAAKNICIAKMHTQAFLNPQNFPKDTLKDNLTPISDWDFTSKPLVSPFLFILNNAVGAIIYVMRSFLGL
jgi:beta-glucosidase